MLSVFILLLSFSSLWSVNKKIKGNYLTPSGLLLTAYFLCTLATLYLYSYEEVVLDPLATTYYVMALGILLLPIVRFDETQAITIETDASNVVVYLSYFLAVFGIFSVGYNFPDMITALSGNLGDNRLATTAEGFYAANKLNVIATAGAYLFSLMVTLSFYWLAGGARSLLGVVLLVGSSCYVVYVLKNVGRDAFLNWGAAVIFNYLLFRRGLSVVVKKWLLVGCSLVLPLLGFIFLMITHDRFEHTLTSDEGAVYPYAYYAGQSPINFAERFLAHRPLGYGQYNFNIVYRLGALLGVTEYDQYFLENSVAETLSAENYFINVFASIVGNFLMDFGKYGTILFVASVAIVMCMTLGRGAKRLPLWKVILYSMYLQVMTGGVFYYFYYPNVGSAALVFSVIAAVAIKFGQTHKHKSAVARDLVRARDEAVVDSD